MTRSHIPDLVALSAQPDKEIRFYASVGAVISLTAALELALTDVFKVGVGVDQDLAEKLLSPIRNTSLKRELAILAMTHKLQVDATLAAEWERLRLRILNATSTKGDRNLVGHNPVSSQVGWGGGSWGGAWGSAWGSSWGGGVNEFFSVSLSTASLAMHEKPRQVEFEALVNSCRELISLLNDLDAFLKRL